jgi:predicted nucleic acid-binding protein
MPSAKTNSFVDTNILVYTIDPTEPEKRYLVGELLKEGMRAGTLVLSPQSLNEFYRVVTERRRFLDRDAARRLMSSFLPYCTAPLDRETTVTAWTIQDEQGFGWWDSLLLASAIRAGCSTFFSEDLQAGRRISGLTILNPFARPTTKQQ